MCEMSCFLLKIMCKSSTDKKKMQINICSAHLIIHPESHNASFILIQSKMFLFICLSFVLSVFFKVVEFGSTTSEERCLLSVWATAPSLSRAQTVTNATAGTLPQSARSLQVCVKLTETERKLGAGSDVQMGRNEEMKSWSGRWKEKSKGLLEMESSFGSEVDYPWQRQWLEFKLLLRVLEQDTDPPEKECILSGRNINLQNWMSLTNTSPPDVCLSVTFCCQNSPVWALFNFPGKTDDTGEHC